MLCDIHRIACLLLVFLTGYSCALSCSTLTLAPCTDDTLSGCFCGYSSDDNQALLSVECSKTSNTSLALLPQSVKCVTFTGNFLNHLSDRFLGNKTHVNLTELNLSDNNMTSVSDTAFDLFPKLEVLNISYNQWKLTNYTRVLSSLTQLRELDLRSAFVEESSITEYNLTAYKLINIRYLFNGTVLPNLSRLSLSGNKLFVLNFTALRGIPNLETLDLSNNKLTQLLGFNASYVRSLQYLNLSRNSLRSLDELMMIRESMKLKEVDISGNTLECSCATKAFLEWIQSNSTDFVNEKNRLKCSGTPALSNRTIMEINLSDDSVLDQSPCTEGDLPSVLVKVYIVFGLLFITVAIFVLVMLFNRLKFTSCSPCSLFNSRQTSGGATVASSAEYSPLATV